jgi:hypothetical protein
MVVTQDLSEEAIKEIEEDFGTMENAENQAKEYLKETLVDLFNDTEGVTHKIEVSAKEEKVDETN